MEANRFFEFPNEEFAQGYAQGVEYANDGALHVVDLVLLPNGKYCVAVCDDDLDDDEGQPEPKGYKTATRIELRVVE